MIKTLLSTAYIYPVCPLSFNHARMFVIADIYARYARTKGNEVCFPIATHYSGNTAQKVATQFTEIFTATHNPDEAQKKLLYLYRHTYKLPMTTINSFVDPMVILDYYNEETIWELKMLDVDADYTHRYTTGHEDFSAFVGAIINEYKKHGVLVRNSKNDLALKYEDESWSAKTKKLIETTPYVHPSQRNTVMSAMKNIRSDWGVLRDNGYGATYNNKIVDPMFDSELFSIFDIYIRYRDDYPNLIKDPNEFFSNLFERLRSGEPPVNELEEKITQWLPCSLFVAEEHLRNWLAKKMHAESILLNSKYQTKKYLILGMGFLNGLRMSASRGNAILSKDLIESFGSLKSRYIVIMQGGQVSKDFTYDKSIESGIDKILTQFNAHFANIKFRSERTYVSTAPNIPDSITAIEDQVIDGLESGYPRNALSILMTLCPKKFTQCTDEESYWLVKLYEKYLGDILMPSLLIGFKSQWNGRK